MASRNEFDGFYRKEGRPGIGGIDYCPYGQEDCLTVNGRGMCNCGLTPLRDRCGNPIAVTVIEPSDPVGDIVSMLATKQSND